MTLLSKVVELRRHIPVSNDFTDVNMPTTIQEAELQYIVPVLGNDLYATMLTYKHGGVVEETKAALLAVCIAVIAPAAMIKALPMMQSNITSLGLATTIADGTQKAFKWEYKQVEQRLYDQQYAAQEALILHLKNNTATFPSWMGSEYNDSAYCAICRSGEDLKALVTLQHRNRVYGLLKGIINELADTYLKPNISEVYYKHLNDGIIAGNLNADDKEILPRLRMALVRKAMEKAGMQLNVRFSQGGFTIVDQLRDEPEEGRTNASTRMLTDFIKSNEQSARTLLEQVVTHLNKNASASKYPEYFASAAYKAPGTIIRSNKRKGVFRM